MQVLNTFTFSLHAHLPSATKGKHSHHKPPFRGHTKTLAARSLSVATTRNVPLTGKSTVNSKRGRASTRVFAGLVPDILQDDFDKEVIQSEVPVLVDFWANWCGPCKLMAIVVEGVQKEYGDALKVVKIETDPNPELVEKYGVYGLPTLIIFKDGQMVEGSKREGALNKAKVLAYLEEFGVVS